MNDKSSGPNTARVRASLQRHFGAVPDPRQLGKIDFPLLTVLAIALMAVLCGQEEWDEMEWWAEKRKDWLATFLELPPDGRTPSADTLARVISRLRPKPFQAAFLTWAAALVTAVPDRQIAIDGKALRRAARHAAGRSSLHLVSAFATANQVVLAQVRVEEKSNEITAIPALLALLDLEGAIVSIDAAGTQTPIAAQIVAAKGDYLLALKGNQSTTHEHASQYLLDAEAVAYDGVQHRSVTEEDTGHGRQERRRVVAVPCPPDVASLERWSGLESLVLIERTRQVGTAPPTTETVFFLSSLAYTRVALIAKVARGHWAVENNLHWCLDVQYREDQSAIVQGLAPEHLGLLRRAALACHKKRTDVKRSLRTKAKNCLLDPEELVKTLLVGFC